MMTKEEFHNAMNVYTEIKRLRHYAYDLRVLVEHGKGCSGTIEVDDNKFLPFKLSSEEVQKIYHDKIAEADRLEATIFNT